MGHWLRTSVLLVCAVGCGTSVEPRAGGNGGAGGDGGSGGQTGGTCLCPEAKVEFAVSGAPLAGPFEAEGVIRQTGPNAWQFDSCPPNADCGGSTLLDVTVSVPQLAPAIPSGTFVKLALLRETSPLGQERSSLTVSNLPTWAGLQNPTASDEAPWLYVNHSTEYDFPSELVPPLPITSAIVCSFDDAGSSVHVRALSLDGQQALPGEAVDVAATTDRPSYTLSNVSVCSFSEPTQFEYGVARKIEAP